ncbi:MAG: Glyoxalase ElbB [Legionellaceae bacterium]
MKKVAVILSGCGVYDGSEIHESVLTLLALSQANAEYQCLAPDILQQRVINHFVGHQEPAETRNVLVESARIARGDILSTAEAEPSDYHALIFPGGFGAAINLCDYAIKGPSCVVEPSVLKFAEAIALAKKPIGFICISPALIAKIYGPGVKMTIGNDKETMETLTSMGNNPIECSVTECVIDKTHKVVSTPAYMLGKSIAQVNNGISQLVKAVLAMI